MCGAMQESCGHIWEAHNPESHMSLAGWPRDQNCKLVIPGTLQEPLLASHASVQGNMHAMSDAHLLQNRLRALTNLTGQRPILHSAWSLNI